MGQQGSELGVPSCLTGLRYASFTILHIGCPFSCCWNPNTALIPPYAAWVDAHDQYSPARSLPDSQEVPRLPTSAAAPEPAVQPAPGLVICGEDDAASVASDASTVVHEHSMDQQWAEQTAADDRQWAGEAAHPLPKPAAAGELAVEPAELPDPATAGVGACLRRVQRRA